MNFLLLQVPYMSIWIQISKQMDNCWLGATYKMQFIHMNALPTALLCKNKNIDIVGAPGQVQIEIGPGTQMKIETFSINIRLWVVCTLHLF